MAQFTHAQRTIFQQAHGRFGNWFAENVTQLFDTTSLDKQKQPSEWQSLLNNQVQLHGFLTKGGVEGLHVPDEFLPLLKRMLIIFRREQASRIEVLQGKTHHLEILGALDNESAVLHSLVDEAWFRDTAPLQLPKVTDFFPIQTVEQYRGGGKLADRKYDEKFHILQAPELFLHDLEYYRRITDMRGTTTGVAFLDIDHFKTVNKKYTETKVDRNLLPRFMQLIEAHVHFHGQAYRQGGDEYLVLLPGFSRLIAIDFLDELRTKVANQRYPQMDEGVTVSIGVCIADTDCYLTNREIQEKANIAKERAKGTQEEAEKKLGRNRIASYKDNKFMDTDLEIVRPLTDRLSV